MTTILVTLVLYKLVLILIGFAAQRLTKDRSDMYLGGRRLGPLVAAISASASSSSVWTLLGVSGMAYKAGIDAIWLFPGCVGGFALNWFVLAPRLRRHSAAERSLTLTQVLAGPEGDKTITRVASLITLSCLLLYVAAQLNGAGKTFGVLPELYEASEHSFDPTTCIVIGALIVLVYMMLGGFWAVSITDTLQGLMMAAASLALPVAALIEVGGYGPIFADLRAAGSGQAGLVAAVGFVLGLLGIGLGYPGQPHVVNRFMALRDETSLRQARRYAMAWAVLVYVGVLTLGWAARLLLEQKPDDTDTIFFRLAHDLFDEVSAGILIAAVLSAIMSTADSQLLVAAASVNHDLGVARGGTSINRDRVVIFLLTAGATVAAIFGEKRIFDAVLSAWSTLGAAFGPLLLWLLFRGRVGKGLTLGCMLLGAGSAVLAHILDRSGFEKNFLPYLLVFALLLLAGGTTAGSRGSPGPVPPR